MCAVPFNKVAVDLLRGAAVRSLGYCASQSLRIPFPTICRTSSIVRAGIPFFSSAAFVAAAKSSKVLSTVPSRSNIASLYFISAPFPALHRMRWLKRTRQPPSRLKSELNRCIFGMYGSRSGIMLSRFSPTAFPIRHSVFLHCSTKKCEIQPVLYNTAKYTERPPMR